MRKRNRYLPVLVTVTTIIVALSGVLANNAQKSRQYVGVFKIAKAEFLKNGPKPEEMPILEQHREYWQRYTNDGTCLLAGHTLNNDETAFGIVVVRSNSEEAARQLMNNCPMVKAGILSVTLFPFEALERKTAN